jgi:hypothetical protein
MLVQVSACIGAVIDMICKQEVRSLGRRFKRISSMAEVRSDVIPVRAMQIETVRRLAHQGWLVRPLQEHKSVCQVANPYRKVTVYQMRRQFMEHGQNGVRVGEG